MERDTVLSHGISNFIKESMMERSDKFCWCICKRCGTLVSHNIKENINICRGCNNDDVTLIQTPYSFKLFIQELETMGIQPRLNTEFIDMPIDQLEFTRSYNGNNDDDNADDDNNIDNENDSDSDDEDDIDYKFFNSQIDNFATKNTIIDEKTWTDIYHKKIDKMKGGDEDDQDDEEEEKDDDVEDDEEDDDEEEEEEEDDDKEDNDKEDVEVNDTENNIDTDVIYEEDTNDEVEEYEEDNNENIKGGDLIDDDKVVKKDDSNTIKEITINM
jgi:hypothetical protein